MANSKALPAFVGLLLLAGVATGAPKITGATEVKAGGFALLRIDGAEKTVLWTITPEPTQEAELYGTLVFTGITGRDYTATAVVIDFDAKTAVKLKHTVRFGGPEPGPQPPTPPDPPAPSDPLVDAIRAAAKSDGWAGDKLRSLATGLNAAVAASTSRASWTVAELAATFQKSIRDAVGGPTPANLKRVLGDAVNAALPRDADHVMSSDELIKARELLTRLSKACEAASR